MWHRIIVFKNKTVYLQEIDEWKDKTVEHFINHLPLSV